MFGIKGLPGWYSTDPEVVPGGRELKDGDYFRLPTGKVFKKVVLYPIEYRLVKAIDVPSGTELVPAERVDPETCEIWKEEDRAQ